MVIQLNINGLRGEDKIIDLCDSEEEMRRITVHQLKKRVARELRTDDDIRLLFRTEQLEDPTLLTAYGIQHMSTIHTVLRLPGAV